ncbi:hypothetical protein BDV59DRAFT_177607 [Aspergillus ambiguus]|uniref:uncharacterized protein n=1 Tax=Aspergillus ambiguus TaxID=176160 RepID=UPI003CCD3D7E
MKIIIFFKHGEGQKVRGIRGIESEFTLDDYGFMYRNFQSRMQQTDFPSKDMIEKIFIPECENILKREIGHVDWVLIFDWCVRSNETYSTVLPPSNNVHIDPSRASTIRRVRFHFPKEADRLLDGRVQMIKNL